MSALDKSERDRYGRRAGAGLVWWTGMAFFYAVTLAGLTKGAWAPARASAGVIAGLAGCYLAIGWFRAWRARGS